LLEPGRVELLTGVNLPMLLKFFTYRERMTLPELTDLLQGYARDGIVQGSAALSSHP
jgi:PTS system mannose-specific IIA component